MNLFARIVRAYGHANFHEEIVELGRLFFLVTNSESAWDFMVANNLTGLYVFVYQVYMMVFYPNG